MKRSISLRRVAAIITLFACLLTGCSKAVSPEPKIQTAADVIATLCDRSVELGYQNALSDLTEIHTIHYNGLTFYRLQQNYKGLPVYGNHVIYAIDENDVCQMITHSIRDLTGEPDLTPTVTEEIVTGNISHYILYELGIKKTGHPLKFTFRQEDLCIYDKTPASYEYSVPENLCLAYQIRWESFLFLVEAHTGEVLICEPMVSYATSPAALFTSGETVTVPVHSNGASILMDADEGICLYDAGKLPYFNPRTGNLYSERLSMVTSKDNIFGNSDDSAENPQTAESVFTIMRGIVRFYRNTLGADIMPNLMIVFNDSGGTGGKKASGGIVPTSGAEYLFPGLAAEDTVAMVTLGYQLSDDITNQIDTAAHEYNHAVSQRIVGWTSRDIQTKLLMEAYSDVMGELTEAAILGMEPNWENKYRNFQEPQHSVYDFSGLSYDNIDGKLHDYSTVISHLAYRMWNGIDGNASKKIPTDQLTQLWYTTMLMLPPDANYSDFYAIMSTVAELVKLTDEQHLCIGEAFQNAKIQQRVPAGANTFSGRNTSIHAMDGGHYFSDCEVIIEDRADFFGPMLPTKEPTVVSVEEKGSFDIHLGCGYYQIRLKPHGADKMGTPQQIMITNQYKDGHVYLFMEDNDKEVTFFTNGYQMVDGNKVYRPIADARISVYPMDSEEPICTLTTTSGDGRAVTQLPFNRYRVVAEADGFETATQIFTISLNHKTEVTFSMNSLTIPEEEVYHNEGPFRYPEVVTLEPDMDYGLYPFPEDFIEDFTGQINGTVCHVRDTDHYGYTPSGTEGEPDVITSPNPYYWWWATFHKDMEQQIWGYLSVLEYEPFNLELVHTKDMGNEWIYVYRYNGKHKVYPVNISGYVPDDGGEYHFAIDISKRPEYDGRIAVEIIAGYGLEPIDPETMEDILFDVGYRRTSNGTEEIEALNPGQVLKCYFCHTSVYPTGDTPVYPEQILYCDACYQEMFGN